MVENLPVILLAVGILLILFAVGRKLLTWYWKIDEIVTLLTEIRDQLSKSRS